MQSCLVLPAYESCQIGIWTLAPAGGWVQQYRTGANLRLFDNSFQLVHWLEKNIEKFKSILLSMERSFYFRKLEKGKLAVPVTDLMDAGCLQGKSSRTLPSASDPTDRISITSGTGLVFHYLDLCPLPNLRTGTCM